MRTKTRHPQHIERLLNEAASAMKAAYAPYSKFRVGAAVLTADGCIFRGCNVENASYGLSLCAERVAISTALAAGHRSFAAMAVVASGTRLPFPCGACRQVIAEFCDSDFPIYVASFRRLRAFTTVRLKDLLPKAFRL